LALLFVVATPKPAHALLNAGAEVGLANRTDLKLGVAFGVHGELSLLPLLLIGPYYLHYDLSGDDTLIGTPKASFNELGLRARLMLPIPGSDIHPYGYVGFGNTWVSTSLAGISGASGHFLDTPIGAGLAFSVLPMFQVSIEGAYRPGFSFGGDAFSGDNASKPTSGWSALLGAAIDL
jgi:hypothetical protein